MLKGLSSSFLSGTPAVGLLFLRVFVGLALACHGWPKMHNPFSWMGPNAPVPGVLQALAAISEFGGGLALAFGFLTPLACLGIMSMMFVATWSTMHGGKPLISGSGPSAELPAVYFLTALLLLLSGPGSVSLDSLIFGKNKKRGGRY